MEAACWAHARRKFHWLSIGKTPSASIGKTPSAMGQEAVRRIGRFYEIEREIHGWTPEERLREWRERAKPLLEAMEKWLRAELGKYSGKSAVAGAIRYSRGLWPALTRFCEDGRIEIDNNAAERALRVVAIGRNYAQLPIMRSWN